MQQNKKPTYTIAKCQMAEVSGVGLKVGSVVCLAYTSGHLAPGCTPGQDPQMQLPGTKNPGFRVGKKRAKKVRQTRVETGAYQKDARCPRTDTHSIKQPFVWLQNDTVNRWKK